MRTEEAIKEKLKVYKEIMLKSHVFTSEFTLATGAVTALKWVLESEGKDELE